MIEGLKIKLTRAELEKLLAEHAGEHEQSAAGLEAKLPELRRKAALAAKGSSQGGILGERSTDAAWGDAEALDAAEHRLDRERRAARRYRFIAAHLMHEDYVIDVGTELGRKALEILT